MSPGAAAVTDIASRAGRAPRRRWSGSGWLSRHELESLDRDNHLLRADIDLDPIFYLPCRTDADRDIFESRKAVMKDFLSFQTLRESILVHSGLVEAPDVPRLSSQSCLPRERHGAQVAPRHRHARRSPVQKRVDPLVHLPGMLLSKPVFDFIGLFTTLMC